jgi:hypothetical protein
LIAKSGHKPLEGAPMMPDAEASVSLPPPEDVWEQELQAAWEKDPTPSRTIRRRCAWEGSDRYTQNTISFEINYVF